MSKQNLHIFFIILSITLIVTGITVLFIPQWKNIQGGFFILFGSIIVVVLGAGGKLEKWRNFVYPNLKKDINNKEEKTRRGKNDMIRNKKDLQNKSISLSNIRDIITSRYDDPSIDSFCMDYFPEVYEKFSRGMRKDEKISLLLDSCNRSPELFIKLNNLLNK